MRDDAPQRPGAVVSSYRIERLIGTGGAAAVYEASRLGPKGASERVACKVMHAERRGYRSQVWREAVLGLRMTAGHPNLVEVLDFIDDAEAQLCIIMELVDGASVDELRASEPRLPFPIVRLIAVEVLEALVHLHGRNVLHRDLSLRNVLVTVGGVVKVTDFGTARMMEQGLVHTQEIRGTPEYLSLEAIELQPLDARADLFSLGAAVYHLVAGQPPCGNLETIGATFARNMLGMFEPLPPDAPGDLADLISGLLRPDRNARRPETAAEALALLRGHGQPVAGHEELAALIAPARARRDQAFADYPPANLLAPGHVLRMREDPGPGGNEVAAPPVRESAPDAVPEHIDDAIPHGLAGCAPALVPDPAASAQPDHVAEAPGRSTIRPRPRIAWRFGTRRAVTAAAAGACLLVLALLRDEGNRLERPANEVRPPSETPLLIARPAPAPLAGPEPAMPMQPEGLESAGKHAGKKIAKLRRVRKRIDTVGPGRDRGRRRDRRTEIVRTLRKPAPITNEPPAWGTR